MSMTDLYSQRGGLPDVADTEMFDFIIPKIPGVSNIGNAGRDMAVLCQQVSWPGRSNEIIEVSLHGQQMNYVGRAAMPRTLSITYVERFDLYVTNTFRRWLGYQRGMVSGVSKGYKSDYAVDGSVLYKYDTTGAVVDSCVFYGLIIEEMPEVSLDGASSNAWNVQATLRYDFYIPQTIGADAA